MVNLIPSFKDSLFESSVDISSDILDIAIDEITENELVKNIPVVGTIIKLGKVAISVRDRHLIKKLVIFIKSINDGSISNEKLEEHKKKLEENSKKLNKELESVIILIDRQLEYDKTMILGNFYKSYINGNIDWEDFGYVADILERLFLTDMQELSNMYKIKSINKEEESFDGAAMVRLSSIGLVKYFNGMSVISGNSKTGESFETKGFISNLGELFYEKGMKNLSKY